MKTTLFSLAAFCTTAVGFGQCDLLDLSFDNLPIFTPITAVTPPAWMSPTPAPNVPAINIDGVGNIALRFADSTTTQSLNSVATRTLADLALPSVFRVSFQVQTDVNGAFAIGVAGSIACVTVNFDANTNPPRIRSGASTVPMVMGMGNFNTIDLYYDVNGAYTLVANGSPLVMGAPSCGLPDLLAIGTTAVGPGEMWVDDLCIATQLAPGLPIGQSYCMAVPNVTGQIGRLQAFGSTMASDNDVTLVASSLPPMEFGLFLTSPVQGFLPNAGGSFGNLCLNGAIGRYILPGQVMSSGAAGVIVLSLDLTQTPSPTLLQNVMAGETRNWQVWHRQGGTSSNYTQGLSITFN